MVLKLNEKDIPSFVKVNSIEFSVLPPITNNLLKVRGKAGAYPMAQTIETREITANVSIIAEEINGVMGASRTLAEWLYHEEPVKLEIADEPDKYYMVLPEGDSNISETLNVGQGTITFVCTEPFAYGESHEKYFSPASSEEVIPVNVGGTAETFPEIDLTLTEDVTNISIAGADGYVLFGDEVEVSEKPVNPEPVIFHDEMDNPTEWTTAINVDNGDIQGELFSNGYSIRQASGSEGGADYGTGEEWHGASGIQALPEVIDDFIIDIRFGFTATAHNQIGKVEMYLLDENNVQFGKVGIQDMNPNALHQRFYARAGKLAGGNYFINSWGDYRGYWKNIQEGNLRIARRGDEWSAYIGMYDEDSGTMYNQYSEFWTDIGGIANNKLAKVQIFIGAYDEYEPYEYMYFSNIEVQKRLTLQDNEVPIIAKKNDVLKIDNQNAIVYKNGEVFYQGLHPTSRFIKFNKGANGLSVLPAKADMKVKYTERWL